MKKTLAVYALTVLTLCYIASFATPKAFASWLIDRSGTLIRVDGTVLGEEVETVTEPTEAGTPAPSLLASPTSPTALREGNHESNTSRSAAAKKALELKQEQLKKQTEIRKKLQEKTGQTSNFELGSKEGKLILKQDLRDAKGKLLKTQETDLHDEPLHVEQQDGSTVQISEVKDETETKDTRESGQAERQKRLEIIQNKITTRTDFALKIGEKNDISVTLPNGKTKEISLPDQALAHLTEKGILTQTDGSNYELTAGKNGDPVYVADGQVEKKFLGIPFLKLKFAQKMEVAATTSDDGTTQSGDVVDTTSQETSPWRRFLERLSTQSSVN